MRSNWKLLTSGKSAHDIIRSHNLHEGDIRRALGDIAYYHEKD